MKIEDAKKILWYVAYEDNPCGRAYVDQDKAAQTVLKKLAEYEQAEEEGRLFILPCKVGDIVYTIPSDVNYKLNIINGHSENNRVYKQTVESIRIYKDDYLLIVCEGLQTCHSQLYQETWFLTREKAEQALQNKYK